jgi:hypothetical protein
MQGGAKSQSSSSQFDFISHKHPVEHSDVTLINNLCGIFRSTLLSKAKTKVGPRNHPPSIDDAVTNGVHTCSGRVRAGAQPLTIRDSHVLNVDLFLVRNAFMNCF